MISTKSKRRFYTECARLFSPLLILALGGVGGFTLYEMRREPTEHPVVKKESPIVETVPILHKTDGFVLVVNGEVVPHREIEIAAEVCGRIVTDHTRSGHFVRKGELLLEIDPTDYQLDTERYTEELKQAKARLEENTVETKNTERLLELAKTDLKLHDKEQNRIAALIPSRAVSESEYDSVKRKGVTAQWSLAERENNLSLLHQKKADLESSLEQSAIRLRRAEENLRRTRIYAPCDGMIVRDSSEPGNYVSVGQSLLTFEDITKVEVRCQLQPKELYWLWSQQAAGLHEEIDADRRLYEIPKSQAVISWSVDGRAYHWKGELKRYESHGVNALTRTVPIRIEIPDPKTILADNDATQNITPPVLTRGCFVTASIHVDPGVPLWQIPTAAIRPGNKIYLAGNNRLDISDVHVVQRGESFSIVSPVSGNLSSGICITSPIVSPKQGMSIRTKNTYETDSKGALAGLQGNKSL